MSGSSASNADMDALFKLPLGEFTPARNALVAELKKAGKHDDANAVKTLVKPSVSAWAVNQLYWRHRGLFDRLIDAGDLLRRAQTTQAKGRSAREAANVRRETVTALTKIAEGLLLGGHYGATRDTLRRVTSTLEALSSHGSTSNGPLAGRLTDDVEPPGFDAVAAFVPRGRKHLASVSPSGVRPQRSTQRRADPPRTAAPRAQEQRRRALAAAKVAVRDAERALSAVRKQAERAAARLDSAAERMKETEGQRVLIEKRLARALKDADGARAEASEASTKASAVTAAVEAAERALELARERLEQMTSNEVRE